MTHGCEKSDPGIVARKPPNETGSSGSEAVEPRAGTKGNADQRSTHRAQDRESVTQGLARIRQVAVRHPRWEPYAGKPQVRFCAGGAQ